jgi:hypothetical protein
LGAYAHVDTTPAVAGCVEAASEGGIRVEGGRKIKEEGMGNIGKE